MSDVDHTRFLPVMAKTKITNGPSRVPSLLVFAAWPSVTGTVCALALSCFLTGAAVAAEPAEVFQRSGCVGVHHIWARHLPVILLSLCC